MSFFSPISHVGIADVLAKGRISGGGSSSSITDNWDAPPEIKAELAFLIIWCIVAVGQFGMIVSRFKLLPAGRIARAPYYLLSVAVFILALKYLLWAINLRVDSMSRTTSNNLAGLTDFLYSVEVSFTPAVLLWLLHIRGRMTFQALGKQSKPFVIQFWKRIVDWSLVGIFLLFNIAITGIYAQYRTLYYSNRLSDQGADNYVKAFTGIKWTILAFSLLLCIDIISSYIALKVSQSSARIVDPVITRITKVALVFVFIETFMDMFVRIYVAKADIYTLIDKINYLYLASAIIQGIARATIIGTLISTMKMPHALTGETVHGELAAAGGGGPIGMPTPPVPGLTYTNQPAYYPAPSHPPPAGNPTWQPPMQQQQGYQPPFGMPYNHQQPQPQQQPQPYAIPV
ncbi:hypothetical protein FRB91_009233 [Serendipita sp. 411]|nr:hypothetical protein FRB91_009233 [Serendipita sp. 411]